VNLDILWYEFRGKALKQIQVCQILTGSKAFLVLTGFIMLNITGRWSESRMSVMTWLGFLTIYYGLYNPP
jgi:hypothetical protein